MVGVRYFALPLVLTAALWPSGNSAVSPLSSGAENSETTLFSQSALKALDHSFPGPDISFLLLNTHTGHIIASRWDHLETPIPMGSLLKPFAAAAYGEKHDFQYPSYICRGSATGCWRPRGHGKVNLTAAIAYSCNSYFRMLTAEMTASDMISTARRFGLENPPANVAGAEFAGLGSHWRLSPLQTARAYLDLAQQRDDPALRQIVEGMAESAQKGTGAEIGRALHGSSALAKTGTAVCTHSQRAAGDGFAVVLVPADAPRILLMVRVHGVPGSHAARVAGQMLQQIEY